MKLEMKTRSKYIYKVQLPRPYGHPFPLEGEVSKLADHGVRKYDFDLRRFLSIDNRK
jgi:hypothetical protein